MQGITEILTDYREMFGKFYDHSNYSSFKEDVCARLAHKKQHRNLPKDEQLNLVIVVNQLLTGFDSKWINTLYLDKWLEGKNLIQAISRTNRLYGPEKRHGIIVWYRYPHTMQKNLDEAIKDYSGDVPYGIFVDRLNKNLEGMNLLYNDIKEMFESVGIENFDRNHNDDAWKKKFSKTFAQFNKKLDSAKTQGFTWDKLTYEFKNEDESVYKITLELSEREYLTLVQRYKEIFNRNGKITVEVPYEIDTHITEIQTDAIDDDYLNSKFKLFMVNLDIGDAEAKEQALSELHRSFAMLSQEDQKYAKLFLNDVEMGKIAVEEGKTLRDYITHYKCEAHNDQVHRLSEGLGIDEGQLRFMVELNLDEGHINEYGRYEELMNTLDIEKARAFFEKREKTPVTKRQAKIKADFIIRKFITEGEIFMDKE